jgi:hypothetical protein
MSTGLCDVLHELSKCLRGLLVSDVSRHILLAHLSVLLLIPLLVFLFQRGSIWCSLLVFLGLLHSGEAGQVSRHNKGQRAASLLGQFRLDERLIRVILQIALQYIIFRSAYL